MIYFVDIRKRKKISPPSSAESMGLMTGGLSEDVVARLFMAASSGLEMTSPGVNMVRLELDDGGRGSLGFTRSRVMRAFRDSFLLDL